MSFDLPARVVGNGSKPFHAWPLPFVEAVGDEHPSMWREKRIAGLQKRCQLRGGVEKTTACKSVTDNDIVLRTITVGFGESVSECNRKR